MTPDDWPVELFGVTESLVATMGPNDRWNVAPLGLFPPGTGESDEHVTARTWGRTRTRGNFERRGTGVVQFVRDPVLFVESALGIVERSDPVHESADAWVRVEVDRIDDVDQPADDRVAWTLRPTESHVLHTAVPTTRRGYNAVVEASVWASRMDVDRYETKVLRERISFLREVVGSVGSGRDRLAFQRIDDLTEAQFEA